MSKSFDSLEYLLSDSSPPVVLLLSGMHGDEYEAGNLLEAYVREHQDELLPFLYIPKVSPTAVAQATRKNRFGNDINRQFLEATRDPEAERMMRLLKRYVFRIAIDLHEDPDRTQAFYLYDSGLMSPDQLGIYRGIVNQTGARLYTGIDDIDDEHLKRHIDRGYISLPPNEFPASSGFSSVWMLQQGVVRRAFTLEIPGKAPPELKRSLLGYLIPFLVRTFGV